MRSYLQRGLLLCVPGLAAVNASPTRPLALVYRGANACEGCPESVASLLEKSSYNFSVTFCGPDENVDLSTELLAGAALYAYPGGPDVDSSYREIAKHAPTIRDFVRNGGRYIGFCLGAYLAGHDPGLDLLPDHLDVDSECEQPGAQVNDDRDAVLQVDWTFNAGSENAKTQRNRWLYFQEGPVMQGFRDSDVGVVARYSSNGDVAASVTPYGQGFVGLVGPHPEATRTWYQDADLENPDGINFDIGFDMVEATMRGVKDSRR